MTSESSPSDPDRNPVDVLADDFAARYRQGETPSITEYVQRYPEHAEQIQSLFPSVALLEQLGSRPEGTDGDARPPSQGSLPPHHRIGDFEILREIGRGGMGVVYEAVQQSLHRPVALKVLNTAFVHSANQAKRFEREAQAAAQLHHTNIVPVFGVGEQGGLRYYVMQRIHGLGLDAVLTELSRRAGTHRSQNGPDTNDGDHSVSAHELAGVLISGELSRSKSGGLSQGSPDSSSSTTTISPRPGHSTAPAAPPLDRADSLSGLVLASAADSEAPGDETVSLVSSNLVLRDDLETDAGIRSSLILRDEFMGDLDPEFGTVRASLSPADSNQQQHGPSHSFGRRYWRNIARIGVQVASGLHYAHSQGTLHRDIKPANILLDTDGTAWIADFGLAKVLEADNVTRTGDVVGTLRYMAPEQFHGEANARSDIYSFGLTLYELLTLGPAYDETDRQQLIARKLTPHDPPSLRKTAGDIPRDLETIVHKCLAYEAKDRYATAGAVLDDLQSFLDDRPIQARQTSSIERLWRWCRRNPAVAGLSGTVAFLLLLTAALTTAGYVQEKQRATEEQALRAIADEEAEKADAARQKAENIAHIAFQAFDSMGQSFVSDDVIGTIELEDENSEAQVHVPAISRDTAAIMEQLRSSFDRLAEIAGEDRRFLDYAAKFDLRAGELHRQLNQWEEAAAAFTRGINLYENSELGAHDPETKLALAKLYNGLGVVSDAPWKWEQKRAAHQQALSLLSDDTARPEARFELARTHFLLGRRPFWGGAGEGPPPRDEPRESASRNRAPSGEEPQRPRLYGRRSPEGTDSRREDGRFDFRDRNIDWERRSRERREHLEQATLQFRDLSDQHPSVSQYRFWLALCHLETAKQSHRSSGADAEKDQAIAILKELAENHPEKADYLYSLSEAYQLSYAQLSRGPEWGQPRIGSDETPEKIAEVAADLREALRVSQNLIQLQPHVPGYAMWNLRLLMNLVHIMAAQENYPAAIEFLDRADKAQASIGERFPEMEQFAGMFRSGFDSMREYFRAKILISNDQYAEAAGILTALVDRKEHDALADHFPGLHHFAGILDPVRQYMLGNQLLAFGDFTTAQGLLSSLVERVEEIAKPTRRPQDHSQRTPWELQPVYRLLAECHEQLGDDAAAAAVRAKLEAFPDASNRFGRGFRPPGAPLGPASEE